MIPSARATIRDLTTRRFDLLVIGGGVTGAGIAREAAHRGLAVALVDQGDFGSGTSSKSSRLIHGGLRYLEQGRLGLVRESLAERGVLLRIAPHLVRPLGFLFPVFRTGRLSRWRLEAGLTLYDLLARRGNVRRHRALSKRAALQLEPGLRVQDLTGGALYWDAQCDDARLAIASLRSALAESALAVSYVEVTGFELADGRIAGATVRDRISGVAGTIRATTVVNATGPWGDSLRRLEDPAATPILAPTRGAHIMVPRARIGHRHAITFLSPIDGRVMFVLPWGDWSYVGTTDTDATEPPDRVEATEADIDYLVRSANAVFPSARLTPEDVTSTWAGLRALVGSRGKAAGVRSREHVITTGPRGLVTILGGKLTTYRRMAIELLDRVEGRRGRSRTDPMKSRSAVEPLPGGGPVDPIALAAEGRRLRLPEPTVAHLIAHYGSETGDLLRMVAEWPGTAAPLHPRHPAIAAEVIHAVRRELARRLDDVLIRRIPLAHETDDAGLAAVDRVVELLVPELGWEDARQRLERERYREIVRAIPRGRRLS